MRLKLLLFSLLLAFIFTPLYPVYAEDSTSSGETGGSSGPGKRLEDRLKKIEDKQNKALQKLEARKEKVASRVAELRAKLNKFKDKNKASLVEKISEQLANVNQKQTTAMSKRLEKMNDILNRLDERVASNSAANTTEVQTAISNADEKIAAAKVAVDAQSKKEYTVSVSSESGVRADAKKSRDQLHIDLKSTQEQVIAAKKAVADAIQAFAAALGGSK